MQVGCDRETLSDHGGVGGLLHGFVFGSVDLIGHTGGRVLNFVGEAADELFVLSEERLDGSVVNSGSTVGLGQEQVCVESNLDPGVVGDEVDNESEEGLDHVEEAEDHPVGEPNLVIFIVM